MGITEISLDVQCDGYNYIYTFCSWKDKMHVFCFQLLSAVEKQGRKYLTREQPVFYV